MCLGGYWRYLCYRELGRLFTWELAIRKDHRLITTGPYSIVRHPSYTAITITSLGVVYAMLGPGSWLRECGWPDTRVGQALAGLWAGYNIFTSLRLCWMRCPAEDRVLREQFPEEWNVWAKRTPYRLIPFVY
jgi:protein-S-isoprenylcysteine O-methyltransferase Ste14